MCLYIQNQNFEKHTENMLNRLAEGAGYAKEQLAAAAASSAALGKQTAELGKKAETALGMLKKHEELEEVRQGRGWGGLGCPGVGDCAWAGCAGLFLWG